MNYKFEFDGFTNRMIWDEKLRKFVVEEDSTGKSADGEWIWIEGYKGTNANMRCRDDFQYELGKRYDKSDDEEIVVCSNGFHLCLKLSDVFDYYGVCNGHRFFKVLALVRKSDVEKYNLKGPDEWNHKPSMGQFSRTFRLGDTKLAAKSIVLLEELTMGEIFKRIPVAKDWSDTEKKMALAIGVSAVEDYRKSKELTELGYSEAFANHIVTANKFDIAKAVGSQTDLSMDMKVWVIFN